VPRNCVSFLCIAELELSDFKRELDNVEIAVNPMLSIYLPCNIEPGRERDVVGPPRIRAETETTEVSARMRGGQRCSFLFLVG
jgi:hypothetical protein